MLSNFQIRVGATLPVLEVQVTVDGRLTLYQSPHLDACGKHIVDPNALDLTNVFSIEFQMYQCGRVPMRVGLSGIATVVTDTDLGITPKDGIVRYAWALSDTAIPEDYYGTFKITFNDGTIYRFPNQLESLSIEISI